MSRVCKLAGCDNPVSSPRAEFCKPAHRAAFWRTQHVVREVEHPRAGKNARSGSQVSYRKAVELLAVWIKGNTIYGTPEPVDAERVAELVLRGALSERQAEAERKRDTRTTTERVR